ncbi:MAG TPA: PEP/pyruvate-binding domain-containing protein [Steroidobacteraceae bacterium]|jgi:pyruvate,water dikinase
MTDRIAAEAIRWFGDIGLTDRATVGGKGASLGELTRAGIDVPPGFVVTTVAFEAALTAIDPAGSLRRRIEQLDPDNLEAMTQVADATRALFLKAALPASVTDAVRGAHAQLAAHEVAVRSSATSEDSADASFAGLQDTQLCVAGVEPVLSALRSCWASLYSRESVSYRLRLNLPERQVAMGVVIQSMLASGSSGVMFTRSPLTGDRSVIVIEASFGLGSAIVSGEVTPDKYVINKVTGEIVARTVSDKAVRHVAAGGSGAGGVRVQTVAEDQRTLPSVSDAQLRELAMLGKRVERHYGTPQDIEWAIAAGAGGAERVYLLQSRPETVWSRREAQPIARPAARAYDHVLATLYKGDR